MFKLEVQINSDIVCIIILSQKIVNHHSMSEKLKAKRVHQDI